MKRVAYLAILFAAITIPAGEAGAQALYNQPGARTGNLGGGLFELMMTGREPQGRPMRAVAPRQAAQPYVVYGDEGSDPYPMPRVRTASRPADALAASPMSEPDPVYRRQAVSYSGREAPGTVVVDTPSKFLYLVQGNGQALRYGIGVGRPGFTWAGMKTVSAKKEWPGWTPPPEMLRRRPDLPRHMEGGPANPLGARALYLGSSLYRIHGTNEPHTIGQNVSSGCIRMMNEDVTDLYERVPVGTKVVVL